MIRGKNNRTLQECFWEKTSDNPKTGCVEWIGARCARGYGMFKALRFGIKTPRAHRISWIMENGEIPEGMYVCHHCDNPRCVRVDHLFLGTQSDNMNDCVEKGRHYKPTPSNHRRGEGVNTAVLNEGKVFQIRRLRLKGVNAFRVHKFTGLDYQLIRLAMKGFTWKHVPFPRHEHDTLEAHQKS